MTAIRDHEANMESLDRPMQDETREIVREATNGHINLTDIRLLVWVVMSLALGMLARTLIDATPVDWRRLTGELILSVIAGVTLYAFGVLQGMDGWQIVLMGGLAGLGGVRLIEWIMAFAKQLPRNGK